MSGAAPERVAVAAVVAEGPILNARSVLSWTVRAVRRGGPCVDPNRLDRTLSQSSTGPFFRTVPQLGLQPASRRAIGDQPWARQRVIRSARLSLFSRGERVDGAGLHGSDGLAIGYAAVRPRPWSAARSCRAPAIAQVTQQRQLHSRECRLMLLTSSGPSRGVSSQLTSNSVSMLFIAVFRCPANRSLA